jgi:Zn-dependent metalloprotease
MKFNLNVVLFLLIFNFFASNAQISSEKEAIAREWIASHSSELNIKSYHSFKLSFVRKSLSGETLRFQQMVNDVPVFDSEILIHFSPNSEITTTASTYDKDASNILTVPAISKENAIIASNLALKVTAAISYQDCKLYVYNKSNETKLIYRVLTDTENINGSWEAIVDAQTGEVVSLKDIAKYHDDKPRKKNKDKEASKQEPKNNKVAAPAFVSGSGMIFNPDPLSVAQATYTGSYVDASDATNSFLDAARSSVEIPELEFASNVYKLKGTYAEIKNLANPNKGLFTQATNTFNFTRFDDGFEAVNAYYHIDKSLRYINQTLQIPCIPLTNSGVLWFDPSAENGADNSHYSNGQLHFGEGGVDDAEDADVILHELGHGLHDWITNGSLSQVNGLSEGSGDYWAQSYSRSLNQWATTNAAYPKVFNWDGPAWSSTRNTNYSPNYPGGLVGQIHTDGQIWSTALMKIWDVIGRTKTDMAFLEGLALTNSSSSQQDAAIAFRQAAIDMNYPCTDIQTITSKFVSKGYTLPALTLKVNCPANQTAAADVNDTYVIPSYASLSNAISQNCDAVITQSPAVGSIVAPGTYTVTMTATSGTTATCNFTLTVTPNLSVAQNVKENVVIFPNPAKNQITIKGEFESNESITIFNLLGQKVIERNSISNEEKIDVSKLESGVYTIYFNASKSSYKFVKE